MIQLRNPLLLLLGAAALATAACERTADGYRLDGDRAAAETREAGEKGAAALEAAGEKVESAAAELEQRAKPLLEDAALTAKVKARLAVDPEVRAYQIDVDTLELVVTLSGRVENAAVRAEAEKLARGTEGVRAVRNNLVVGDEPLPVSPPAPASGAAAAHSR